MAAAVRGLGRSLGSGDGDDGARLSAKQAARHMNDVVEQDRRVEFADLVAKVMKSKWQMAAFSPRLHNNKYKLYGVYGRVVQRISGAI